MWLLTAVAYTGPEMTKFRVDNKLNGVRRANYSQLTTKWTAVDARDDFNVGMEVFRFDCSHPDTTYNTDRN